MGARGPDGKVRPQKYCRDPQRYSEAGIPQALALIATGVDPAVAAEMAGCSHSMLRRRLAKMRQMEAACMLVDDGGKSWAPKVAEAAIAVIDMLTAQARLLSDEEFLESNDPAAVAALTSAVADRITAAVTAYGAVANGRREPAALDGRADVAQPVCSQNP